MRFTQKDFEDVYATARMAHTGQKRRSGEDYFMHPSEVRNIVRKFYPGDHAAQMTALLHDTIEDAPGSTVRDVEEMEEFIRGSISDPAAGEEILLAVKSLTHGPGVDYSTYVQGLLGNELALRVKLADMLHNLSSNPSPKQKLKYQDALDAIAEAAGGIPEGISPAHWRALLRTSGLQEGRRVSWLRSLIREMVMSGL